MDEIKEILKFYQEIGASFLEQHQKNPGHELKKLHHEILSCHKCSLHLNKTNYVPGEGSSNPDILFIGEGPGETEDQFGKPFIGKAGQLLDKIIKKMGYSRESVFIGNIVKCRPPHNRDPEPQEVEACLPYMARQINILQPKVIVCLGRVALNYLLAQKYSITKIRGRLLFYHNIPVIPTFHPAFILHQRNPQKISDTKWQVWTDMETVLDIIANPAKYSSSETTKE